MTELAKVDIMYDLLEREGLAVYEADRSIKAQRREHQAADAEGTAEAAEADAEAGAEAKGQAEEEVHPQRHSPSAPFASDGK